VCAAGVALDAPEGLAVSPDGRNVYVATLADPLAVLQRDPLTGALTQRPGSDGCVAPGGAGGCAPAIGLDNVRSVVVSPDGRNVYAAAANSDAVVVLERDGTDRRAVAAGGDGRLHLGGRQRRLRDGERADHGRSGRHQPGWQAS